MDPEKKEEIIVNDESELDKAIEDSINDVKAGNEAKETTLEAEVKEESLGTPENDTSDHSEKKEEGYEFRIPNKGKFESDESYELRIQLLDQVKKKKLATTPEAKANLSDEISKTKGQLKNLNGNDKSINNLNKIVEDTPQEEDEALKADRERLRELGGATKEDIQEVIRQERFQAEAQSTLNKFIDRSVELKDPDVREVFFDFVDSNYNWQGKAGKELLTVLELARENMFKPSESIQERFIKGANVAEKINSMQFPGNTGGKVELSSEMRKDIDELKATGMSEEKALELLLD